MKLNIYVDYINFQILSIIINKITQIKRKLFDYDLIYTPIKEENIDIIYELWINNKIPKDINTLDDEVLLEVGMYMKYNVNDSDDGFEYIQLIR